MSWNEQGQKKKDRKRTSLLASGGWNETAPAHETHATPRSQEEQRRKKMPALHADNQSARYSPAAAQSTETAPRNSGSNPQAVAAENTRASYSNNPVTRHLNRGIQMAQAHNRETAEGLAEQKDSRFGKILTNIITSANIGALTLTQEGAETLGLVLSSMPPAETAMQQYRHLYSNHGTDTVGLARQIEDMGGFTGKAGEKASHKVDDIKTGARQARTNDYNQLTWLTTDPAKAAYLRPDKLTGDFFEKFLPAYFSMMNPNKAAKALEAQKWGTRFVKATWIVKNAYNAAYNKTTKRFSDNPQLIDKEPDYHEYKRQSRVSQEQTRKNYIEAKARQSGVQSCMISLAMMAGSEAMRTSTRTGEESAALKLAQDYILSHVSRMNKEAYDNIRYKDIENIMGSDKE